MSSLKPDLRHILSPLSTQEAMKKIRNLASSLSGSPEEIKQQSQNGAVCVGVLDIN